MVRWIVIASVAAIAFTIYALVDLVVTPAQKVRAFPKPIWIAVIVALPVIGPVLWLTVGKSRNGRQKSGGTGRGPDDDPGFLGSIDRKSSDERIRRLEEELRRLDEEDESSKGDENGDKGPSPKKP